MADSTGTVTLAFASREWTVYSVRVPPVVVRKPHYEIGVAGFAAFEQGGCPGGVGLVGHEAFECVESFWEGVDADRGRAGEGGAAGGGVALVEGEEVGEGGADVPGGGCGEKGGERGEGGNCGDGGGFGGWGGGCEGVEGEGFGGDDAAEHVGDFGGGEGVLRMKWRRILEWCGVYCADIPEDCWTLRAVFG